MLGTYSRIEVIGLYGGCVTRALISTDVTFGHQVDVAGGPRPPLPQEFASWADLLEA